MNVIFGSKKKRVVAHFKENKLEILMGRVRKF